MFHHKAETAVILGAGFSKCAKLPLTSELSKHLLHKDFSSPHDIVITEAIREFLVTVFSWEERKPLPTLEDLFTMIDLSANSGHNLGYRFTPRLLRALRRILIYRVFEILDQHYAESDEISRFLKVHLALPVITTHFIVLNWDIVLERHMEKHSDIEIDYCVQGKSWGDLHENSLKHVAVVKVHGSSNWVYCDNCRTLFYYKNQKLSLAVKAGLIEDDFRLFGNQQESHTFNADPGFGGHDRNCRRCQSSVGPHIATFSYRKSFRTHAFAASWLAAEEILTQAKKWIFIGYSLPDADYEFKHLLKTCELKLSGPDTPNKEIDVVMLGDKIAETKYRGFFGQNAVNIYQNGLDGYVAVNHHGR